jgi:mannitol-1-phosphate/altronate dehydrogenase
MQDTTRALALTETTLQAHAPRAAVPTYDRRRLTPGVVHLGVGGFHRAHQALYFDDLAEHDITTEWGITGVSLRRRAMQDALEPQQGLYTVVERGGRGDRARVVGALRRQLFAPQRSAEVLAALADERTRLVTLTVTGGGYGIDEADADMTADQRDPGPPTTAAGFLVEGLARRRRAGIAPFTVLSCDNIPDNGAVVRAAVVGRAERRDEILARWIEQRVSFPGSMVDRITPQLADADRRLVAEQFGIDDRWPVITEPFSQWVVEDDFCNERPPLEEVGVEFTDDVTPYRLTKTRLLNAGHCAIGYLGFLAGYRRTDEAMADPVLRAYISRLMEDEIAPLLPPVPGMGLAAYRRTLLGRLANASIGDRLARLCERGSTKMPAYLLPSLIEARRCGQRHELLTLALAAWLRYLRGVDIDGRPIAVVDARAERLGALARSGGGDPRPLLAERAVFGDLGADAELVEAVRGALESLDRLGVIGAVSAAAAPGRLEVAA